MNKKILKALKALEKCSGDCKNCKKLLIPAASNGKNTYYAFLCGIADEAGFEPYSNSIKDLKKETVECLEFELS